MGCYNIRYYLPVRNANLDNIFIFRKEIEQNGKISRQDDGPSTRNLQPAPQTKEYGYQVKYSKEEQKGY